MTGFGFVLTGTTIFSGCQPSESEQTIYTPEQKLEAFGEIAETIAALKDPRCVVGAVSDVERQRTIESNKRIDSAGEYWEELETDEKLVEERAKLVRQGILLGEIRKVDQSALTDYQAFDINVRNVLAVARCIPSDSPVVRENFIKNATIAFGDKIIDDLGAKSVTAAAQDFKTTVSDGYNAVFGGLARGTGFLLGVGITMWGINKFRD